MGCQIRDKIKSFITFSVAINESADVTDTAQLCVFIRGVDESLTVGEEFLELVPMKDTTTACDIFCFRHCDGQCRSGLVPCCQFGR